jgi:iron complex outermembrane receptor protein
VRYAEEQFGLREVDKQTSHNRALTANWGIGDFTLTSITGISAFRSYQNTSGSGGSPESWLSIFTETFNQFSQDVRLLSPTGQRVDHIVGAYYDQST